MPRRAKLLSAARCDGGAARGLHLVAVMLCRVYAPTAAAPLLWLGLQKIARTPAPRLAVGYRLAPRVDRPCGGTFSTCLDICWHVGNVPPHLACRYLDTPVLIARPLGENLLLERIVAGGIVGETLPLANRRLEAECQGLYPLIDVWA